MSRRKTSKCGVTGKIRYRSDIDAKIVLSEIQHKDSSRRPKIETKVYNCPHCKGWHLTSKPQPKKGQK